MDGIVSSVWRYRFFIYSSIKTELKVRFIRSRLGGMWMILHPLSQVIIFAFVLSTVMAARLPGITNKYAYSIYLMSGILSWSLFTEILTRSVNIFIDNGNLLKKMVFPKITLPLIVVGSALANNLLLFAAILFIFGLLGHWPGAAVIWLPVLMIINVAFALGFGLALGVVNVFVRDVGQMVPVGMQFLFWGTPIVYMTTIIPEHYRSLLALNPLSTIVTGYQNVLLYNTAPDWRALIFIMMAAIALLATALWIFRRASPEMVDQL